MVERELRAVYDRIGVACKKSGRSSDEIELVLVTKEVDLERIQEAYRLGHRLFGENKVQEFTAKKTFLPSDIQWHFIGNLQTNKVKFLVQEVALIHSCDRMDLALELEKQAELANSQFEILIQVNTSAEPTKHGFDSKAVEWAVSQIKSLKRLNVRGLMTIGPNTQDEKEIRSAFSKLRHVRDELGKHFPKIDWHYLSMGMSSDFEFAIEEGANLLRIGTAVFGKRDATKHA